MAATLLQIEGFDILADAANLSAKGYTNGSYATRDVVAGRYEGSALRLRYQEVFTAGSPNISTLYCPRTSKTMFSSGSQLEGCVGFAFKTDNFAIGSLSAINPPNSQIFFNLGWDRIPQIALGVQSGYISIYRGGEFYSADSIPIPDAPPFSNMVASYRDYYAIQGQTSGILVRSDIPALATGVYSYIELEYKLHAISGYVNLFVDSRQFASYTGNTVPFSSSIINTYEFNASPASFVKTSYVPAEYSGVNGYWINNHFDDFYYSSITGSGQHYGPSRIKSLHATGIYVKQWQNFGGFAPDVVNTNDSDTSYMGDVDAGVGTYDYYGMNTFIPTASGEIKGIDEITVGKGSTAVMGPLVNITGINYIGGVNHSFTSSYLYYENLWRNKPNTGVDWLHSDVSSNYWGYKRLS